MEKELNLKLPHNLGERDILPEELVSCSSEAQNTNERGCIEDDRTEAKFR